MTPNTNCFQPTIYQFTDPERDEIKRRFEAGQSVSQIAREMHRQIFQIRMKLGKMGLVK